MHAAGLQACIIRLLRVLNHSRDKILRLLGSLIINGCSDSIALIVIIIDDLFESPYRSESLVNHPPCTCCTRGLLSTTSSILIARLCAILTG